MWCDLLDLEHGINLRLTMTLCGCKRLETLKSTDYQFELEERELLLDKLLDSFEDLNFSFYTNRLLIIIEDATKDVLDLDNGDYLFYTIFECSVKYLLKELSIVVQI